LKLGFVLQRWGLGGGTAGYAVGLTRYLASVGVQIDVWCAQADLPAPEGVKLRVLGAVSGGLRGRLAFAWATRALDRRGIDVVQAFDRTVGHDIVRAGGGAHAAWLQASGRPCQVASPLTQVDLALDRAALTSARLVVCNSERGAGDVVRYGGVDPGRVEVVRNGVDLDRFRPCAARRAAARQAWGVEDDGRVALFFGSGFRRKGLDVAGEAFARVAGPRDRLVVLGGDARAELTLGPLRARLGPRLIVLGVSPEPERWLPGADAMVLPTRYDPAANATLEALACGVPTVTTSADGNQEIVPEPAWVVEAPRDGEAVARALGRAWADGGARCRAAAAAWTVAGNGERMRVLYDAVRSGAWAR